MTRISVLTKHAVARVLLVQVYPAANCQAAYTSRFPPARPPLYQQLHLMKTNLVTHHRASLQRLRVIFHLHSNMFKTCTGHAVLLRTEESCYLVSMLPHIMAASSSLPIWTTLSQGICASF